MENVITGKSERVLKAPLSFGESLWNHPIVQVLSFAVLIMTLLRGLEYLAKKIFKGKGKNQRHVSELTLSVRTANCLKDANIRNIADLVRRTETEMLTGNIFGRESLNEIKELLSEMGLSLGMNPEEKLGLKEVPL